MAATDDDTRSSSESESDSDCDRDSQTSPQLNIDNRTRRDAKAVPSYYGRDGFRCAIYRTKYGDISSFGVTFPDGTYVGNHPTDEYNWLEVATDSSENFYFQPSDKPDIYASLEIEMLDLRLECRPTETLGQIHLQFNSGDVFVRCDVPREFIRLCVDVLKNTNADYKSYAMTATQWAAEEKQLEARQIAQGGHPPRAW